MKLDTFIGTFTDTAGKGHAVELRVPPEAASGQRVDQTPTAIIHSAWENGPRFTFYVHSILESARHPGREFYVANGFGDEIGTFTFPASELRRMATELEAAIPAMDGQFRVTWTPADPRLPF
jgi:hypothetical protein